MKQSFKKNLRPLFIGLSLVAILVTASSWGNNTKVENPIPGITSVINTTFAVVDAQTEMLVPSNKIYHRSEALELKKNLENMLSQNSQSLAVNLALVRYHTCAPNFVGGFKGIAMQYAANIYRLNAYIGCLAYEYIYLQNNDFIHAREWYKLSLVCRLQEGMEWREIVFPKQAPFGVGVKGAFSNGRVQPLYENLYGTHKRKIMISKSVTEPTFTLVPDFLHGTNSQTSGRLIFTPF